MKKLMNNSGELGKVMPKIYGNEVYDLIVKGEGVFEREREMILNNKASYFEEIIQTEPDKDPGYHYKNIILKKI